jgi:hypothetical protein
MKGNFLLFLVSIDTYVLCDTIKEAKIITEQLTERRCHGSGKVDKNHIDTGCDETNFNVPQWCLCVVQSLCTRSSVLCPLPVMIQLNMANCIIP